MIDTPRPIDGLVPVPHRRPVLVVDGERYTLLAAERRGTTTRYTLERARVSLYDLPGASIEYDEERHLTARRERAANTLGWLAYVALLPLIPLLGFLPHALKQRLLALGIDPAFSTGTSIAVEWLLCWPTVGIFLLTILAEARWFVVLGAAAVPLTLVADLAYRWSGQLEDPPQQRAMLSVLPGTVRGVMALARGTVDPQGLGR